MKIRSTARATARERRQHQRRATQSVALGLMVAGLLLGAFAAPSVAVDGESGGNLVAGIDGPASADPPIDLPVDDDEGTGSGGGSAGGGPADLPDCKEGEDPVIDACVPPLEVCEELTDVPPCDEKEEPPVCDPEDANPATPECDPPIEPPDEECGSGTVDNGNGVCVPEDNGNENPGGGGGGGGGGATPCIGGGKDYNGPNKDGCGSKPATGGSGSTGSAGGGITGNGSAGNGSLGSSLGRAEGSVPGAEAAAQVTACGDSVICQSAPAATTTTSTTGLPETGAPRDSRQLLVLGLGLLGAGGLLLKPGRRGRHRLVGA